MSISFFLVCSIRSLETLLVHTGFSSLLRLLLHTFDDEIGSFVYLADTQVDLEGILSSITFVDTLFLIRILFTFLACVIVCIQ